MPEHTPIAEACRELLECLANQDKEGTCLVMRLPPRLQVPSLIRVCCRKGWTRLLPLEQVTGVQTLEHACSIPLQREEDAWHIGDKDKLLKIQLSSEVRDEMEVRKLTHEARAAQSNDHNRHRDAQDEKDGAEAADRTGRVLSRCTMPNNKEIADLRRLIRRESDGAMDSVRLADLLPLLESLYERQHARCLVSKLSAEFRGEILWAAFEDELVEVGRRAASTGDNTIHMDWAAPDDWQWENPAHPRGSQVLSYRGKSIAEILADMHKHDERMRRMKGFDEDVLWHLRLKHAVSDAQGEWQATMLGGASDDVLKRDDKKGKRRGASGQRKRAKRTELTEKQSVVYQLHKVAGLSFGKIAKRMSDQYGKPYSDEAVRKLFLRAEVVKKQKGGTVHTLRPLHD